MRGKSATNYEPTWRNSLAVYPGHVRRILALYDQNKVSKAEGLVKVLAREPWRRMLYRLVSS